MTRVYVGGLPVDIRPDDVMYEFRRYEPLRVDLKQGFGFLEFREPRDADDAVHDMDGHKIGGRPIAVQFARGTQRRDMPGGPRGGSYDDRGGRGGGYGPPPSFGGGGAMKKGSGYQVEVEGLDSRTSWQDLKDFARGAGNVQFADVFIRHGKVPLSNTLPPLTTSLCVCCAVCSVAHSTLTPFCCLCCCCATFRKLGTSAAHTSTDAA